MLRRPTYDSPRRSACSSVRQSDGRSARCATCIAAIRRRWRTTMLNFRERRVLVRDSRRGNVRRGSPCARARTRVIASDTVSRLSQIQRRVPAGVVLAIAGHAGLRGALASARRARRAPARISSSRRTMPTRSCIISCRSCWIWYGFSAVPCRARTAPAHRCDAGVHLRAHRRAATPFSFANSAAYSPARFPNTSRSDSELPPSRFAPWMPGRALAGGEQPRHRRHLRVAVDLHAAHHVVRRRADLHRLGGDVDVGQLLELVVHARQLLLDVLGARSAASP